MKNTTIAFIGGGNMARALISGLLAEGWAAQQLIVLDIDADKLAALHADFHIATTQQAAELHEASVIILSTKPQQIKEALLPLLPLHQQPLLVSIAAGIPLPHICNLLDGYTRVIRVMPNTPAQIRAGISVLYAHLGVTHEDRQLAEFIFGAVGATLWLEQEAHMDAVTALSGSGPAYVFYFIEAMQQAGINLGLSEEQARLLSLHTFAGASQLASRSSTPPRQLRQQVTSKGGTTERAITFLDEHHMQAVFIAAIQAAAKRAQELTQS